MQISSLPVPSRRLWRMAPTSLCPSNSAHLDFTQIRRPGGGDGPNAGHRGGQCRQEADRPFRPTHRQFFQLLRRSLMWRRSSPAHRSRPAAGTPQPKRERRQVRQSSRRGADWRSDGHVVQPQYRRAPADDSIAAGGIAFKLEGPPLLTPLVDRFGPSQESAVPQLPFRVNLETACAGGCGIAIAQLQQEPRERRTIRTGCTPLRRGVGIRTCSSDLAS